MRCCGLPAMHHHDRYEHGKCLEVFANGILGNIGAIIFGCAEAVAANANTICAETNLEFDRFRQSWDLHHDWEERVTYVPQAITAWQRIEGGYRRIYSLEDHMFVVFYFGGVITIAAIE